MPVVSPGPSDTARRILDIAERLVQTQGFNAFSYADIAAELRITKASLHYHFASKATLGSQLIARYSENFQQALEAIDEEKSDARQKLRRYAELYARALRKDRMCLCGMLASDYATLPKPMKEGVRRFFDNNEVWLARLLEDGRRARTLRFTGPAEEVARTLIASFEGAMLVARSYGDAGRFDSAANRMVAQLDGK
jgi:TetR/AcrR family transcriptional regulator, transcriptional repressor for nem operon